MKFLRDHGQLPDAKDIAGAHNRIKRPKSGTIAVNSLGRHTRLQQAVSHIGGLIVALGVVVAADQEIIDLARLKQLYGRMNAAVEEWVWRAIAEPPRTSKNQPDMAMRNLRRTRVQPARGGSSHHYQ